MSEQCPPFASPVPRTGLGSRAQESVDGFLKALKLHTRRLSSVMEVHAAELALLERLYYKGKNQHGASLLWARVCEMRRYAQRLRDLDLLAATQNLRAAFYGEITPASKKTLKGSWTHYPNSQYMAWLLRRLSTATELADKTATSMLRIFEWILLFMQNGEFLQMTVTFSALAARFRHLSVELRPLARLMHEDIRLALVALYPIQAKKVRSLVPRELAPAPLQNSQSAVVDSTHAVDHDINIDEDLGVALSCVEPLPVSQPLSRTVSHPPDSLLTSDLTLTPVLETILMEQPPVMMKPLPVAIKAEPAFSTTKGAIVFAKKRKDPEPTPEQQKKFKKKRARRDEIDDIFG